MCNHPDLFEGRPIVSAFDMLGPLSAQLPSAAVRASERSVWDSINLQDLNLLPVSHEAMSQWEAQEVKVCVAALLLLCRSSPLHFEPHTTKEIGPASASIICLGLPSELPCI